MFILVGDSKWISTGNQLALIVHFLMFSSISYPLTFIVVVVYEWKHLQIRSWKSEFSM